MSTSTPVLDRVGARLRRLSMRADAMQLRLTRGVTLTERVEAESGDPEDWSFLRRPALLGLLAVVSICVGASLPSSPFKLEMGGTWFFGEADWPSTTLMLPGVVAVYGGMILFVRVWYGLFQTLRARGGVPIRPLAYMLALWILPLLVVAPLFSRDVFSYAAQGEMMSHHINPYHYGPGTLGSGPYDVGRRPAVGQHARPLRAALLDAGRAGPPRSPSTTRCSTIELLRLQSVAGLALIAYCIPKLARSFGRDPGPAFVLAVLNPLTLLALVGGAHNDAIMVGPAAGRRDGGPVAPPGLGRRAVRAGRLHQGPGRHRHRLRRVGLGRAVRRLAPPRPHARAGRPGHGGRHGRASLVSGLGWGWIANLGTPGTVRSWMAPATGFGLLISGTAHLVGIGVGLGGVLTLTRAIGLIGAAVIAVYCLRNRERIGVLGALGGTMMAFVLLGPVVQPWYLTWGIIIVAPVVTGRWLYAVLGLSAVAPFIGLTGGSRPAERAGHTDPASMVLAVMVLWAVAIVPLGNWTTSWRLDRSRLPALPATSAALES